MSTRAAIRACAATTGLILLVAAPAIPLQAQVSTSGPEEICVSFDVPQGHWSLEAARRLEALGLVQIQATTRTLDACRVDALLQSANLPIESGDASSGIDAAWIAAFAEEYPGIQSLSDAAVRWPAIAGGNAAMGAVGWTGWAAPGLGEFPPERSGALETADQTSGRAGAELSARLIPPVWAVGSVRLDQEGYTLDRMEIVGSLSPVALSIGRGAVGFGYAKSGGTVIGNAAPLDRVEVSLSRPLRLPGVVSRLGSISFDTFLGRIRDDRHPGDPFLWGASGSLRPHPRMTFAIHRAAMFGGREDGPPVTAENLLNMLIGRVIGAGFENQIVSVEGIFRLPTERFLPVTAYMEWGAEDAAGAWWDVPGRIIGAYVPAVPGLSQMSAGLEYTSLAQSCCYNPEWYRHWSFPGAWTLGDQVLGHPLGGQGTEWMVYSDLFLTRPRAYIEGSAFRRNRGDENLFVPGREGTSWGGDTTLRWRIPGGREIFGSVSAESGDGWSERSFSFGGRLFLR